jgi:hypothetical protein
MIETRNISVERDLITHFLDAFTQRVKVHPNRVILVQPQPIVKATKISATKVSEGMIIDGKDVTRELLYEKKTKLRTDNRLRFDPCEDRQTTPTRLAGGLRPPLATTICDEIRRRPPRKV